MSSPADIIIFGGAAGGGKSWGLLMEPLRHVTTNLQFSGAIFRRNVVQVKNPGGLWDESMKMYPLLRGKPVSHLSEWRWEHGGRLKFAHLEHDSTVLDWQGAQIPFIGFDELTHFTQAQFFYMLSRNRSMCGVRPYIRATTNPDADSWVATLLAWWIDQETGFPIPERAGVIRWFTRINDVIVWADSPQELIQKHGRPDLPMDHEEQVRPKSLTFIPSKLSDNKALMAADPDYLSNLKALSYVERARLLDGNWKVKPAAGMYFKRNEVNIVDQVPDDLEKVVRQWDLAATEPSDANPDPDWTAGVKMARRKNGRFFIWHCEHVRAQSHKVRDLVTRTTKNDGYSVTVGINQDPGQAGKEQGESYAAMLAGYKVIVSRETGEKTTRADGYAAQWQAGNIDVLRGSWNEAFFFEHEAFGGGSGHDDMVDAAAGAFNKLTKGSLATWQALGRQ